MTELSAAARKTLFRCTHRGTKELDLMLGSFARLHVADMDRETLAAFNDFTELPEPVILEILIDKLPLPADMPPKLADLFRAYTYKPDAR